MLHLLAQFSYIFWVPFLQDTILICLIHNEPLKKLTAHKKLAPKIEMSILFCAYWIA